MSARTGTSVPRRSPHPSLSAFDAAPRRSRLEVIFNEMRYINLHLLTYLLNTAAAAAAAAATTTIIIIIIIRVLSIFYSDICTLQYCYMTTLLY